MPAKPGKNCVRDEMRRWKAGDLHSGTGKKGVDGPVVKDRKQAIAIALSVCGKSDYADHLVNLGFSKEAAFQAAELLAKAPDWDNQFLTGETLSRTPREDKTVIAPSLPGMDVDNRPGRQPGSQGKRKNLDTQGLYPMVLPKGNPQQGPRSRSDLKGTAAFSEEYEEQPQDPLTGQCKQKEKREQRQQQRTPEQQQADKERASEMAGKPVAPNADREAAAKKAAETRKRCKTGTSSAKPQSQTTLASGAGRGVTSSSGSGAGSGASSGGSSSGGAGSGAGGGAGSGAR